MLRLRRAPRSFTFRRHVPTLMLRRFRPHLWLLVALPFLAGCAGTDFTEIDFGSPAAQQDNQPQLSASALLARYGGRYEDPALQGRLESIVSRLARAGGEGGQVYSITILDSPQINAFALDNGQLFVTRGLLAYTSSPDDAAAVLAHEMAHVILRHGPKRRAAVDRALRNASLFGNGGEETGDMSRQAFFRSAQYSIAQYTQAQELEADRLGQSLMKKAGYDPGRAVALLVNMAREDARRARAGGRDGEERLEMFLSSHPSSSERISRARGFPAVAGGGKPQLPDPDYIALMEGMVFGDTSETGFLRHGRFLHPVLRITFTLPEGYRGENTPDAVFAAGPENQLVRFDADRVNRDIAPAVYIRNVWLRDIEQGAISSLEISDRPVAWTRVATDRAQFYFGAIRWDRSTFYRFMLIAPINDTGAEAVFLEMMSSMRPLSEVEARSARPLRVALARVPQSGPRSLLAALPRDIHEPQSFLAILNGVEDLDDLPPGTTLKIVVP